MKKILWRLILGIGFLCLPITCVCGLVLTNAVNPMSRAFLTSFVVLNDSREVVHVTPVGTIGRNGERRILPLSPSKTFSLPLTGTAEVTLLPGEQHEFAYDWDDINFSELVVHDERGNWKQLITDPAPTQRQYHEPLARSFTIPPLSQLPEVTKDVIAAAKKTRSISTAWGSAVFSIGLIGPVLIAVARSRLKKLPPPLKPSQVLIN